MQVYVTHLLQYRCTLFTYMYIVHAVFLNVSEI